MALRIKGSETHVNVVVDGELLAGSFTVMDNWKWQDLSDILQSDFLGESESEFDYQHHGYEFNFTIEEMDNAAVNKILLPFVASNDAGNPLPNVNLVFVKSYRDPALAAETITFKSCVVKMDSQDIAGRKDYLKTSFTGRCRAIATF